MTPDYSGWPWGFMDVVLVLILAAALVYGIMQWRRFRPSSRLRARRDEATRQMFRENPPG